MTGFFLNLQSFLRWLWAILDGNKTLICSFFLLLLQLPIVQQNMNDTWYISLNILFGTGGILSLGHRISKGAFTADKNI